MSSQPDVIVQLDDRVRLMSSVLAATDWPERAQQRQPHGTHHHARATRKYVEPYRGHDAAKNLQGLLDQGAPLEALFAFGMQLSWPELEIKKLPRWVPTKWDKQLRDFYHEAGLQSWWEKEATPWKLAVEEAQKMFVKVSFKPFLKPFLGEVTEKLTFIPNVCYPTDQEIGSRRGNELVCIAPPRLAWGDSPPWPFDEDPSHIYRAALTQFGRLLLVSYLRANPEKVAQVSDTSLPVGDQFSALHPTWEEQFTTLFVAAAVAIYLEDHVSKPEAKAYLLMERKARGMTILPGTVSVLRRYLSEYENGRYDGLLDFLPIFPKQLRIANRIVTL